MFCSNCGAPLGAGAAFCQECGTAVPQRAQAAAPVQPAPQQSVGAAPVQRAAKHSRRKRFLIVAGALFGLLVLCSIIGSLVDSEPEEQAAATTPAPAVTSSPSLDLTPATTSEPIAAAEPASVATVATEPTPAADAAALLPAAEPAAQPAAAEPTAPASTTPPVAELTQPAGPPQGVARQAANMRDRPTAAGSTVIGALTAGEPVVVRRVTPDGSWYAVETLGGVIGWVSGSLLTVAPEIAAQLPRGTTDEAVAVRPTAPVPPPAAGGATGSGATGGGTGGSFDPIGEDCPENAPIKGNINSRGEYIYHSPGQQAYIRTIPEQCFATGAQATAAGFRPAQR